MRTHIWQINWSMIRKVQKILVHKLFSPFPLSTEGNCASGFVSVLRIQIKEQKANNLRNFFLFSSWRSMTKIAGSGSGAGSVSQRYGSADPVPKCLGSATLLRTVCWELATDSENFAKRGISRVQIFRKTSEIIGVNYQLEDCLKGQ